MPMTPTYVCSRSPLRLWNASDSLFVLGLSSVFPYDQHVTVLPCAIRERHFVGHKSPGSFHLDAGSVAQGRYSHADIEYHEAHSSDFRLH